MNQINEIKENAVHDLLIEMISEVEKDMEVYEIKKKPFKEKNTILRPSMAYRTADLLDYMYKKCNKENRKLRAMQLLEECFNKCTLTALHYINLYDLRLLIKYHKEKGLWRIRIDESN